jgi:hypothetical protein
VLVHLSALQLDGKTKPSARNEKTPDGAYQFVGFRARWCSTLRTCTSAFSIRYGARNGYRVMTTSRTSGFRDGRPIPGKVSRSSSCSKIFNTTSWAAGSPKMGA